MEKRLDGRPVTVVNQGFSHALASLQYEIKDVRTQMLQPTKAAGRACAVRRDVLGQLLRDVLAQVALESSDAAPDIGALGYWSVNAETQHGTHATRPDKERSAGTESDRRAHERKKTDQWYRRGVVTVHDPCIGSLDRDLSVGRIGDDSAAITVGAGGA